MISRLTGTVHRLEPGSVIVDVRGVGYAVAVPADVYDLLPDGAEVTVHTFTYVREDRLGLFGFADRAGLLLFKSLIAIAGIGPKIALELCSVPRDLLLTAVTEQDARLLQHVKGVGKKTAETLLVELKALAERKPEIFAQAGSGRRETGNGEYDQDAVEALRTLGYDTGTILKTLKGLPKGTATTEERVAAALRSL